MPFSSAKIVAVDSSDFVTRKERQIPQIEPASSFRKLFSDTVSFDFFMIGIGSVGSVLSGTSPAIFCILFGLMLDALNSDHAQQDVNQIAGYLVLLALATGLVTWWQSLGWTLAAERQLLRFRVKYIKAIMSHDIEWFLTSGMSAEEMTSEIDDTCNTLKKGHKGMGDFLQQVICFALSFAVSFYYSWTLSVILLSSYAVIAVIGNIFIDIVSCNSILDDNETLDSDSAETIGRRNLMIELLGKMRTIITLNIQQESIKKYQNALLKATKSSILRGFRSGLKGGFTVSISLMVYGIGLYYSVNVVATQILDNCSYNSSCVTPGTFFIVFFSFIVSQAAWGKIWDHVGVIYEARVALKSLLTVIDGSHNDRMSTDDIELESGGGGGGSGSRQSSRRNNVFDGRNNGLVNVLSKGNNCSNSIGSNIRDELVGDGSCDTGGDIYPARRPTGNIWDILTSEETAPNTATSSLKDFGNNGDNEDSDTELDSSVGRSFDDHPTELVSVKKNTQTAYELAVFNELSASLNTSPRASFTWRKNSANHSSESPQAETPKDLILNSYSSEKGIAFHSGSMTPSGALTLSGAFTPSGVPRRMGSGEGRVGGMGGGLGSMSPRIINGDGIATPGALEKALWGQPGGPGGIGMGPSERGLGGSVGTRGYNNGNNHSGPQPIGSEASTRSNTPVEGRSRSNSETPLFAPDEKRNSSTVAATNLKSPRPVPMRAISEKFKNITQSLTPVSPFNRYQDGTTKNVDRGDFMSIGDEARATSLNDNIRVRVLNLIKSYAWCFFFGLLGATTVGLIFPLWGLLIADMQSLIYIPDAKQMRPLSTNIFYDFLILALVCAVGYLFQQFFVTIVCERIAYDLRFSMFERLIKKDLTFFGQPRNTLRALCDQIERDPEAVNQSTAVAVSLYLQVVVTFTVSIIIGFCYSWQLTFVFIAAVPVNLLAAVIADSIKNNEKDDLSTWTATVNDSDNGGQCDESVVNPSAKVPRGFGKGGVQNDKSGMSGKRGGGGKDGKESGKGSGKENGKGGGEKEEDRGPSDLLTKVFRNIHMVHGFNLQAEICEYYEQLCFCDSQSTSKSCLRYGFLEQLCRACMPLTYALFFWFGSILIQSGTISFHDLMAAINSLLLGVVGTGIAIRNIVNLEEGSAAARRMFLFLEDGEHDSKEESHESQGSLGGDIELRNIVFRYPTSAPIKRPIASPKSNYSPFFTPSSTSRSQSPLQLSLAMPQEAFSLEIESLIIPRGQFIAIVGPSGSGKSTLFNLLLRLYEPCEGVLSFDGEDAKNIDATWLRSNIGYVESESVFFTGTIADNIDKRKNGEQQANTDNYRNTVSVSSKPKIFSSVLSSVITAASPRNNAAASAKKSDHNNNESPDLESPVSLGNLSHNIFSMSSFKSDNADSGSVLELTARNGQSGQSGQNGNGKNGNGQGQNGQNDEESGDGRRDFSSFSTDVLEAASTMGGAHEFIAELEGGYATVMDGQEGSMGKNGGVKTMSRKGNVGRLKGVNRRRMGGGGDVGSVGRGVEDVMFETGKLTAGQKQLVGLARGLVRHPSILLLDDVSSCLPSREEERAVERCLRVIQDSRAGNETTIVISHKLSLINDAEVIIVIGEGRIQEQGTHEQLMNMHGWYAAAWINESHG